MPTADTADVSDEMETTNMNPIKRAIVTVVATALAFAGISGVASAQPFGTDGGFFSCGQGYGIITVRWQGLAVIHLYTENNPNGFVYETANSGTVVGQFVTKTFYPNLEEARWTVSAPGLNTEVTGSTCGYP